jgi:hypothetical protein
MKTLATACIKIPADLPGSTKVWLAKDACVVLHDIRAFVEGYKRLLEEVEEEKADELISQFPLPEQHLIEEIMDDNPGISVEEAILIMEDTDG